MQTQKDLVAMHPRHGIMNIDVLSFGRLAYRVFEETGGGNLPVLDDEGKNLVLRKIAGDYEDQLSVLRGNMKKLGYISEVKSVISEFTQYDIGEEEIDQVMEAAGRTPGSTLSFRILRFCTAGSGISGKPLYHQGRASGRSKPGSAEIGNAEKQHCGAGRLYRFHPGAEPAFAGAFEALPEALCYGDYGRAGGSLHLPSPLSAFCPQ